MLDLSKVPLVALSNETKHLISTLLNPPKVIPCSNGLLRDWRGFAQVCSIKGETLPAIAADSNPLNLLLNIIKESSQDFTLQNLKEVLEKIERWDIVDDSEPYLEKDAKVYLERLEQSQTTAQENDFVNDADILTLDDQFRIECGQEKQHYDAFLLYADEDEIFAKEVVDNLEKKNNIKLCLKERDLIAGISFEHEAIIRLISERCNRLIIIISPDFLKSPANKFFVNFAQANGIDKKQERKIIPCIYKNCELPPQLQYFSKIYYKNLSPEFFWDKLIRSMKSVPNAVKAQKSTMNINKTNLPGLFDQPVQVKSKNEDKVKDISSGESSMAAESNKSRSLLPWKSKQKMKSAKTSIPDEESSIPESIPSLPSLDGLDSLSSLTNNQKTTKKSKKKKTFMGTYVKKVQSLLAKS